MGVSLVIALNLLKPIWSRATGKVATETEPVENSVLDRPAVSVVVRYATVVSLSLVAGGVAGTRWMTSDPTLIANATLNCEWSLPLPPADQTLDLTKINVIFVDGNGEGTLIGKVESSAGCGSVEQAWYYDDATNPTKVLVCPQTCTWIQGDSEARIDVKVGCQTEVAPVL